MPAMNFAFHCETPLSTDYPFLLRCPKIEDGIKECQKRGKQVLMSLGGASGGYGFRNNGEAKLFARRVWDLILGGNKSPEIRPFGKYSILFSYSFIILSIKMEQHYLL